MEQLTCPPLRHKERPICWRLTKKNGSQQQRLGPQLHGKYSIYGERTCGQSVVSAFMFMMYNQLAKDSLNVARESLKFFMPSRLAWSVSVSSTNSDIAGSRNPRPCGASGYAPDWERAKRDP